MIYNINMISKYSFFETMIFELYFIHSFLTNKELNEFLITFLYYNIKSIFNGLAS